jgi:hypothetical protein
MRLNILSMVVLPMILFASAQAQAGDPLQMAVVSYGKIPAGAGFQTELADNSELEGQVEERLKTALSDRGLKPAADGNLVISIAADRTGGSTNLSVGSGQQSNAQVNINIDTGQNALLGGGNQPPSKIGRAYRITLAIYDKATGRYVWRAEVSDRNPDVDPTAATPAMVEKLVNALQKSLGPAN